MTNGDEFYSNRQIVHDQFIEVDGYNTHYLECGDIRNPPLVLVHGGNFQLGIGAERWYPVIVPLSKHFRVFAVDELGGGFTDPPRNIADIGDVKPRADHVMQFVEKLGVGPVHLVGQSQGAWIAAYIALKRPDLVDGLVLVDSASLASGQGMKNANISENFKNSFAPGTMYSDNLRADADSVRRYVSIMMYEKTEIHPDFIAYGIDRGKKWLSIWDEPWKAFWEEDGGKRAREQHYLDGVHLREHLHKLNAPILIIWGKNTVKGLQSGISLFESLPDAEMHLFDKANHFLWIDQPERFCRSVISFLTSLHSPKIAG